MTNYFPPKYGDLAGTYLDDEGNVVERVYHGVPREPRANVRIPPVPVGEYDRDEFEKMMAAKSFPDYPERTS